MNKPRYTKTAFCVIIFTTVFWYGWIQAEPIDSDSEQNNITEAGRDNPFAGFISNENPAAQNLSQDPLVIEEKPELFVETVTLKFLEAGNLRPALASMSSKYGNISIDDKSNSLIVCDSNEILGKIVAQIEKADRTPEQIMVEVVILDVQLGDDTEIGVDWDRFFDPIRDHNYVQTLIPTTLTTGGVFTLTKNNIIGTVHALQQIRNVEILASPRILVASGKEAYIQTTEEIPYTELTESTGGTTGNYVSSTKFKDAGVTLKVKATIVDGKKILMALEPEQSINTGVAGVGTGEGSTTVPIVDKRKASTTLIMEDGQVLIMGGLRKKETRVNKSQIPLLGDIPLVGMLFSYDKRDIKNSELIVLVSPHISKDEPISEEAMKKFTELRDKPILSLPSDWRDPFRTIGKPSPKK
ncbi:MAG: secretin N-terminal domain-containing protein [Phycisphaerae bacterium]|jgi:general secretion pathway protein D